MRTRPARLAASAATALTLMLLTAAAGCGDDEKSASEQVCDARKDLGNAVDSVATDVKDGDLGEAQEGLSDVSTDFASLTAAFRDLTEQERADLQQQADQLKTDVRSLTDAKNKDELSSAVDKVQADLKSLQSSIGDSLKCS